LSAGWTITEIPAAATFSITRRATSASALASAQQLLQLGDQAAVKQIVAGKVSDSGGAYRRIARHGG